MLLKFLVRKGNFSECEKEKLYSVTDLKCSLQVDPWHFAEISTKMSDWTVANSFPLVI